MANYPSNTATWWRKRQIARQVKYHDVSKTIGCELEIQLYATVFCTANAGNGYLDMHIICM